MIIFQARPRRPCSRWVSTKLTLTYPPRCLRLQSPSSRGVLSRTPSREPRLRNCWKKVSLQSKLEKNLLYCIVAFSFSFSFVYFSMGKQKKKLSINPQVRMDRSISAPDARFQRALSSNIR